MKPTQELLSKVSDIDYMSTWGIYFLMSGDEIIYIGKTTNGLKRVVSHIPGKKFDNVLWIEVIDRDDQELSKIEKRYIMEYNPILNKTYGNGYVPKRIKHKSYWFSVCASTYRVVGSGKYKNKLFHSIINAEYEEDAIDILKQEIINSGHNFIITETSSVYIGENVKENETEEVFENIMG